jgi:hypothetical protein
MKLSLKVLEEKVLMKIFGLVRDRIIKWRKLRNEELHNLPSSLNIIIVIISRKLRWGEHVARVEERNALRVLLEKSDQKRPLGRLIP